MTGWQADCPYCDWQSDVHDGPTDSSGKADAKHERALHIQTEHPDDQALTWWEDCDLPVKINGKRNH